MRNYFPILLFIFTSKNRDICSLLALVGHICLWNRHLGTLRDLSVPPGSVCRWSARVNAVLGIKLFKKWSPRSEQQESLLGEKILCKCPRDIVFLVFVASICQFLREICKVRLYLHPDRTSLSQIVWLNISQEPLSLSHSFCSHLYLDFYNPVNFFFQRNTKFEQTENTAPWILHPVPQLLMSAMLASSKSPQVPSPLTPR